VEIVKMKKFKSFGFVAAVLTVAMCCTSVVLASATAIDVLRNSPLDVSPKALLEEVSRTGERVSGEYMVDGELTDVSVGSAITNPAKRDVWAFSVLAVGARFVEPKLVYDGGRVVDFNGSGVFYSDNSINLGQRIMCGDGEIMTVHTDPKKLDLMQVRIIKLYGVADEAAVYYFINEKCVQGPLGYTPEFQEGNSVMDMIGGVDEDGWPILDVTKLPPNPYETAEWPRLLSSNGDSEGEQEDGSPESPGTQHDVIDDVIDVAGHWAKGNIEKAVGLGILDPGSDCEKGRFRPDEAATRLDFVTWLAAAAQLGRRQESAPPAPFVDLPPGTSSRRLAAVDWAFGKKYLLGTSSSTYNPNTSIARQDAATILYRAAEEFGIEPPDPKAVGAFPTDSNLVADYALEAVCSLMHLKIILGKGGGNFDPLGQITRAEVIALVTRMVDGRIKK
jgi:hypothetical protein